jgi:hypothetical protein
VDADERDDPSPIDAASVRHFTHVDRLSVDPENRFFEQALNGVHGITSLTLESGPTEQICQGIVLDK